MVWTSLLVANFLLYFLQLDCPNEIYPWEIRLAFPGESQLQQSRAIQPSVHAGCFSVSIIHQTLTWTTGSLMCAQMYMHAIGHGDVRPHVREFALKVALGEKSVTALGNRTCLIGITV